MCGCASTWLALYCAGLSLRVVLIWMFCEQNCVCLFKTILSQFCILYLFLLFQGSPTALELYDSNSQVIKDEILGPFNEYENLTLACVAYGGEPKPQVNWYRRVGYSEQLIDSSYEYRPLTQPKHGALSSVVNILTRKLSRQDYRAVFCCRSTTSGYRPVLERSIRVDLNRKFVFRCFFSHFGRFFFLFSILGK